MLKSQEDMEEDNQEGGEDDWRKLISNPMTIFSDFVKCKEKHHNNGNNEHMKIIRLSVSEKWKQ